MPKKFDWTDEKIAELKAMHPNSTVQQLADHFGFSLIAMYANLRKFGLGKPRKPRNDLSPVGTISHRKNGQEFIMTENGWVLHSLYLWQQAGREIPEGYKLFLKDKHQPLTLDNIELKTMREIALLSVQVRARKGDPNSKTAIRIREQEERRLKRIAEKKARAEAKAKEAEQRKQQGYQMTPARQAQLEKVRQQRSERAQQRKREEVTKKRQAKIEKEWQKASRKSAKREELSRLSTIQRDFSKITWVQVDKKTRIELKPGQKPEDVIRKYSKQAA